MKYVTYLKTLKKCPFCDSDKKRILLENDGAFLTFSLAPYHKYHLLVIPKKHVQSIKDLTPKENAYMMSLVSAAVKVLGKLKHDNCTVFMRDGKSLGKSIKHHLHWNIVPGGKIEDVTLNLEVRRILSPKEQESLVKRLKNIV